ncbi:50S ribosomal protein L21 [candidate division WWE3 bacterium RIFOXYC1_FULL_42_13]|uniref:Large ribosomal subunit protein bL21 n=2 Tax=Katanobacteria TaxID=422282 RepID=A0A0G0YRB2_UNCKA|nr:MAG: 50S ribosomal protein L21 [candidate division WWE3 bacterium GW2011_GWA1_42_12]KKS34238.1 MAG: 50S ribosomal protein L21 [candidate division WWE3 bacterium GW2011_GWD1_42_14]KKS39177.1 MAG: 50S ribosomal protein L21 [candidate division WWE3 bacterium GW2011_GWF1_42_14]KKS40102.1 MAG: 50S ribosomal protein L21 [candidate division WWE3 bacterium GW2011_GWE1_42_16]KKS66829.1 MAG: 50S ribosomal protein L21 [candidate division WWE3 bacterium GW2011_GWB1_42_6]OGC59400.1 MAG: 50S ribosomal pr
MDKYAIIKIGSAQYKVHEGETLIVDNQNGKVDSEVLLFSDGKTTILGDPIVKDAHVKLKISGALRGDKIVVGRFKSKSRYRKNRGYRDTLTELLVEKIELGGKKDEEEKKVVETPKKVVHTKPAKVEKKVATKKSVKTKKVTKKETK